LVLSVDAKAMSWKANTLKQLKTCQSLFVKQCIDAIAKVEACPDQAATESVYQKFVINIKVILAT
jgi:hypothetical protein